eukprot:Hpha_TRINITY_DN2951_c0_g1::TRINITY_DN2951_c0_g1_i1::g.19679::m.19679
MGGGDAMQMDGESARPRMMRPSVAARMSVSSKLFKNNTEIKARQQQQLALMHATEVAELREQTKDLERQLDEKGKLVSDIQLQLQATRRGQELAQIESQRAQRALTRAEAMLHHNGNEGDVALHGQLSEAEERIDRLEKDLSAAQQRAEAAEKTASEATVREHEQMAKLSHAIKSKERERDLHRTYSERLVKENDDLAAELQERIDAGEDLQRDLSRVRGELDALRDRSDVARMKALKDRSALEQQVWAREMEIEQLKRLVNESAADMEVLENKTQNVENLEGAAAKASELQRALHEARTEVQHKAERIEELTSQIEQMLADTRAERGRAGRYSSELRDARQREQRLQADNAQMQAQGGELQVAHDTLRDAVARAEAERDDANQAAERLRSDVKELERKLRRTDEDRKGALTSAQRAGAEANALKKQLVGADTQAKGLKAMASGVPDFNTASGAFDQLQERLRAAEANLAHCEAERERVLTDMEHQRVDLSEVSYELDIKKDALAKAEQNLARTRKKIAAKDKELQMLRNQNRDLVMQANTTIEELNQEILRLFAESKEHRDEADQWKDKYNRCKASAGVSKPLLLPRNPNVMSASKGRPTAGKRARPKRRARLEESDSD